MDINKAVEEIERAEKKRRRWIIALVILGLLIIWIVYPIIEKAIKFEYDSVEKLEKVFSSNRSRFETAIQLLPSTDSGFFEVRRINDDAKKPAHICVKKTSTLQILTSETLSEEEYQAIDQVFSELFEHTPVIRCRPASSGFSFMVDEYYGRLEWFSELLYYPEELDHDKIGTIVTGHHSTSCALEPHWEAHIYYIN